MPVSIEFSGLGNPGSAEGGGKHGPLDGQNPAIDLLKHVHSTQQNWVIPGTARPESNPGLYHSSMMNSIL